MAGTVRSIIRLTVPAAKAVPSPAFGQALGSLGINIMAFCKEFNGRTTQYKDNMPMRVRLTSKMDNSYTFDVRLPQTGWFLKEMAGLEKGSAAAGKEWVGQIHVKQIYELAKLKAAEDEGASLAGYCRSIASTCRTWGIKIVKS